MVVESLSSSQQIHLTGEVDLCTVTCTVCHSLLSFPSPLTGHSEEVSTLAALGDGTVLASSSHAHNSTPCEIRIWKLPAQKCSKVQ